MILGWLARDSREEGKKVLATNESDTPGADDFQSISTSGSQGRLRPSDPRQEIIERIDFVRSDRPGTRGLLPGSSPANPNCFSHV